MPNAKDATKTAQHRILALGDTGSGKTTQILTLSGRKFCYLFDSNAILSLQGHDVDYEEFLPDRQSLAVRSLSAKIGGDKSSVKQSTMYQTWEQDFDKKLESGFFDSYDVIGIDSVTTLLDLIMDRVLSINGIFGQWPTQDMYGPQMMAFTNICRALTSMGKTIYMTGHLDIRQDDLTKRVFRRPMMTGRLTTKIPLLFSDVLVYEAEATDKGVVYKIQTIPDRITTCVRTSIKGLEPYEPVTVDFTKDPVGQGLGGILNWSAKHPLGEQ